ncbi:MAG: DUF3810 domain-containing protein [Clostridia bacterium]|nr:DUF3810 domain-containing protein [Clostridia bacterium]
MAKEGNSNRKITLVTMAMLIVFAVFVAILLTMLILRTDQDECEFICRRFVNAYQAVAGRFYSVTSINIFEILVTLAILFAITCIIASIVLFCKRKKIASRRVIFALLTVCVGVANLYIFSAGFAYNRDPVSVVTYQGEIDKDLALKSFITLIDDLNKSYADIGKYNDDGSVVCPYTDKQLDKKIRQAVDEVLTDDYFYRYTPKAKPVISSGIMTLNRIAGITFLPTCEPGYNKDMPVVDRVHTIAHEFAHTKGVMREYEANIVGAYVLLNSGDAFLKYCGYIYAIGFVNELVKYDETYFDNLKAHPIVDGFQKDQSKIFKWWLTQPSLGDIGEFFNNLYLKSNGQEDGTGSYEETPGTEEIIIGGENGEPDRYLDVITEYTNIHRMLVMYATQREARQN